MKVKLSNQIPEISIKDFNERSPHLLIMGLDEFIVMYKEVISKPHRISFYQITLFLEGSGYVQIDSRKFIFSPASLITLGKGQVEIFQANNDAKGYTVLFSEEFINKYPEDLKWIYSLNLFNPIVDPVIVKLSRKDCDDLIHFIKKMKLELTAEKDFAYEEILFNLLKTLILMMERIYRTRLTNDIKEGKEWGYFVDFKHKLEEQFEFSRSVQYYANLLSITPKKLNQTTNCFCGKSAKQLIEERVLLEMKRLLIHTTQTIKGVGHSLGFNDPTNFNKFFKRYVKVTPAEFRSSKKSLI